MRRLGYIFEYVLLKTFAALFNVLPLKTALQAGEQLGLLLSKILKKREPLVLNNLRLAFPEKSDQEVRAIAEEHWRNIGRTAVEFLRAPYFLSPPVISKAVWEGTEAVEAARAAGKGAIIVACHFSSWEILGMMIQNRFKCMMAIARPMKNPFVERWLQDSRAQGGIKITLHRDAVKASLRWLRAGNFVGILVDQNLYTGGVFANFFGRPAATTPLPTLLHLRTGAPIFFTFSLREGNTFRAVFEPLVLPEVADEDQRLLVYTQLINNGIERIIRKHPGNWFWIHNRWKRQPQPGDPVIAG